MGPLVRLLTIERECGKRIRGYLHFTVVSLYGEGTFVRA